MQVGRLAFKCRCGAWRWCDRAEALGEENCNKCGTSFEHAAIEFWGTGAPSRSREHTQYQLPSRKGSGAATAGKGGKGANPGKGKSGKGPQSGPKLPGRQDHLQKGSGKSSTATAGTKPESVVSYNTNKFKTDPVYAAKAMHDMAKSIYGEECQEAQDASQKVEAALKAVEERRTPAQRATSLREDRSKYIDAIAKGIQRTQHLQSQQEEIEAELGKLDSENRLAVERLTTLDEQIAQYELAAGLRAPLHAGGQISQEPADQVQEKIKDIFAPVQKALEASGGADVSDKLKEFEIAMGEFQTKTMAIMRQDAEMAENDELNNSDSDLDEGEPRAKTARREEPDTVTSKADIATEAENAEEEWTQVLGPQARRAQKEHRLAQKSMQDITKKLQMSSAAVQLQSAGNVKGKGKGKGPGKGPLRVVKPATTGDKPTERPSKWDVGPPPLSGANFPPAGALWSSSPSAHSAGAASSSAAAQSKEDGQTRTPGVTVELSAGEWKEILATRGGDGHLS